MASAFGCCSCCFAALKITHRAVPIVAYDFDGHLIPPALYREYLQDSLVQVHFHLLHAKVGERDLYYASIHAIRVLYPSSSQSISVYSVFRRYRGLNFVFGMG